MRGVRRACRVTGAGGAQAGNGAGGTVRGRRRRPGARTGARGPRDAVRPASCRGLLPPGERTSVEPPTAAGIGPERGSAAHQSRQHLVAQAARSDAALLAAVRRQVPPAPGSVAARIVDDTGFPERGEHSVGVTRQYRGGLGRLLSLAVAGAPTPPHLAGLAMELVVVPLLVLWQGRVARSWDRTG